MVDVNSGDDAELSSALCEAGVRLSIVRKRIVELRRDQRFASMRDLQERVNAQAQLPRERLGNKQLALLQCSPQAASAA